jgi:hypothetical protein
MPLNPMMLSWVVVNRWHGGDAVATQTTSDRLLQTHAVGAIHLSHNDGQADRHDLIPADIWFADRIPAWRQK